jgi:hypothetical protein
MMNFAGWKHQSNWINSKFLEEARQLEHRWKKTGLLEGIEPVKTDRYMRTTGTGYRQACVVLLQNQQAMNGQKIKGFRLWVAEYEAQ